MEKRVCDIWEQWEIHSKLGDAKCQGGWREFTICYDTEDDTFLNSYSNDAMSNTQSPVSALLKSMEQVVAWKEYIPKLYSNLDQQQNAYAFVNSLINTSDDSGRRSLRNTEICEGCPYNKKTLYVWYHLNNLNNEDLKTKLSPVMVEDFTDSTIFIDGKEISILTTDDGYFDSKDSANRYLSSVGDISDGEIVEKEKGTPITFNTNGYEFYGVDDLASPTVIVAVTKEPSPTKLAISVTLFMEHWNVTHKQNIKKIPNFRNILFRYGQHGQFISVDDILLPTYGMDNRESMFVLHAMISTVCADNKDTHSIRDGIKARLGDLIDEGHSQINNIFIWDEIEREVLAQTGVDISLLF